MKISVITITYNSEKTLERTIKSVINQNFDNFEYIIIDGNSNDKTIEIINKYRKNINKFISEKDTGIYDAINKGINLASGNIISILHSNDIFINSDVLKKVSCFFKNDKNLDVLLSNLIFKENFENNRHVRSYKSSYFKPWMLRFGFSPPHLSTFFTKKSIIKIGMYNLSYKIAGDFEFFVRAFLKHSLKYKKFNEYLIVMSTGGLSGKNFCSHITSSLEINKALKSNGYYSNFIFTLLRFPIKIFQFFI